jgi:hypothetical protein
MENRSVGWGRPKSWGTFFVVMLLGLSATMAVLVSSSSASGELYSVNVTVQTTESLPYQYTLTAYNTSGYQVANFYGNYPEAAFGLPQGTYLITASAYYQQENVCYPCPLGAGVNSSAIPIILQQPSSEYGYAVVQVSSPSQLTIATKNDSSFPLVNMPVHVSFFNGTAAAGAYVSAYVVGMGYSDENLTSYGQTGPDGNFTLVMPDAPVQVSAYLSVPIQLPENTTTVPVEVGGQKVNVTVYWQPNEVQLQGQALIVPPLDGADITLQVQQQPYPIVYGESPGQSGTTTVVTETSTASVSGQPSGQSGKLSPFSPTELQLLSLSSPPVQSGSGTWPGPVTLVLLALGAGAILVAVVAAGIIVGKRKRSAGVAQPV